MGLEDELNNFSLSLTNPSAQSDLLKIEQWKEKITLYKDATSDQSQIGIQPVSHTWGKKNILGMSDNDVVLDLQQQRLERALGAELGITQNIIKRTGVFDEVDKKYLEALLAEHFMEVTDVIEMQHKMMDLKQTTKNLAPSFHVYYKKCSRHGRRLCQ